MDTVFVHLGCVVLTCVACWTSWTLPSFRWMRLTPILLSSSRCSGLFAMKSWALRGGRPIPGSLTGGMGRSRENERQKRWATIENRSLLAARFNLFSVHTCKGQGAGSSYQRHYGSALSGCEGRQGQETGGAYWDKSSQSLSRPAPHLTETSGTRRLNQKVSMLSSLSKSFVTVESFSSPFDLREQARSDGPWRETGAAGVPQSWRRSPPRQTVCRPVQQTAGTDT